MLFVRVVKQDFMYQLTFMPRFFPVNCYVIEEKEDLTIIDTALPYSWKRILKICEGLKKPLKRIVLTHAHDDHVGSLDTLKKLHPDILVYISKRDARLLEGDRSVDEHEPQMPIKGGIPKNIQCRADVLLQEGDDIGSLTAISTPGHTPGSMSFLDSRNNSLIAGDAFQTWGGVAVSGTINWMFPFPALATWSKERALESAYKIQQIQPTVLAVGHGDLLHNPDNAIRQAIKRGERSS